MLTRGYGQRKVRHCGPSQWRAWTFILQLQIRGAAICMEIRAFGSAAPPLRELEPFVAPSCSRVVEYTTTHAIFSCSDTGCGIPECVVTPLDAQRAVRSQATQSRPRQHLWQVPPRRIDWRTFNRRHRRRSRVDIRDCEDPWWGARGAQRAWCWVHIQRQSLCLALCGITEDSSLSS